jgi:hypothetical protein
LVGKAETLGKRYITATYEKAISQKHQKKRSIPETLEKHCIPKTLEKQYITETSGKHYITEMLENVYKSRYMYKNIGKRLYKKIRKSLYVGR